MFTASGREVLSHLPGLGRPTGMADMSNSAQGLEIMGPQVAMVATLTLAPQTGP